MSSITEAQRRQYRDEGYFVLERYVPEAHIELLRGELQHYIDYIHAEMDRAGSDTLGGINQRNKRYFIMNRHNDTGKLRAVLFSDYMADICRATIGGDAWLLNEQYTLKCPGAETAFSWHQDSGYIPIPHDPFLVCWIAMDDMSEANGTLYVLPYSRAGVRTRVEHVKAAGSNDMIGYQGNDPGIPVIIPSGSVLVFSSLVFHRSGPNRTDRMRRAFNFNYGIKPLVDPSNPAQQWATNEPFLRDGKIVVTP
jgi:ectoine hydroxylase-related dioxygenase (phytanoyl-CoA dioxygenase family)